MWRRDWCGILRWNGSGDWWWSAWLLLWHTVGRFPMHPYIRVLNSLGFPVSTMRFGVPMEARFASRKSAESFVKKMALINRKILPHPSWTIEEVNPVPVP